MYTATPVLASEWNESGYLWRMTGDREMRQGEYIARSTLVSVMWVLGCMVGLWEFIILCYD